MTDEQASAIADTVPAQAEDGANEEKAILTNKSSSENSDNKSETEKDTNSLPQSLSQNPSNAEKNDGNEKVHNNQVVGMLAHKSDTAQILKPVLNQPPISVYGISQSVNKNNDNQLNQNSIANNQNLSSLNENQTNHDENANNSSQNPNFFRSLSANKITSENESSNNKTGPQIFHRQIAIAGNSNSPIQQHLSVPVISIHNNSINSCSGTLAFHLQQQQNLEANTTPVITGDGMGSSPDPNAENQHRHHHHHHHRKHHQQEQTQDDEDLNDDLYPTSPKSALCISPSALQEILSKEDDEPELELTPQTSAVLEVIKKTGKLYTNLSCGSTTNKNSKTGKPNSISARNIVVGTSQEGVSCRPNIIRKLQRDKVNAIIKGKYDEAKEADILSKRVTDAVIESVEEDQRFERQRQATEKLDEERRTFSEFHKNWIEKVKEEEEILKSRMEELNEIHRAEMEKFEVKWNNEDFLRRFSKPSANLLQLKAIERSMVIAKMFDDAKAIKSRAEHLEKIETREQQNRAESEMKVERSRLLDKQRREMQSLKEKCDSLLNIVKRNMEREEAPYKARISKLEADLKSGNETKTKMVPSRIPSSMISPRGSGNELLTAKTAFKFSAYKVKTQSLKLKIKPLGSVTITEKKKSKTSKK